ncbi:MAG: DUF3147 family protein [Spirochaetes bacterium]|nr:DUF3147 family protein [Spirochaetota bacterium]
MLTPLVISRTALSFLIAGVWISFATLAGEKFGSRLGGLITNLPSNIVVSLLFIALTKGVSFAAETASSVPLGMAISITFVVMFAALLPFGILFAIGGALTVWFVLGYVGSNLPLGPMEALYVYIGVSIVGFLVLEFLLGIRSVPRQKIHYNLKNQLLRAVFAGGVVAGAVLIAQVSPPRITGIAASFPAVMLSTLTILHLSQGAEFARATAKILVLSSSNIIVYVYATAYLYPRVGLGLGTLLSFLAAVGWSALFLPISKKLK